MLMFLTDHLAHAKVLLEQSQSQGYPEHSFPTRQPDLLFLAGQPHHSTHHGSAATITEQYISEFLIHKSRRDCYLWILSDHFYHGATFRCRLSGTAPGQSRND